MISPKKTSILKEAFPTTAFPTTTALITNQSLLQKFIILLTLPTYVCLLISVSLPSMLQLAWAKLQPFKSSIISLCFFLVATLLVIGHVQNLAIITTNSQGLNELIAQREYLLTLEKKYPIHRDIFINLAKVYQALNQNDLADQYQQKAQQLDPGYQLPI